MVAHNSAVGEYSQPQALLESAGTPVSSSQFILLIFELNKWIGETRGLSACLWPGNTTSSLTYFFYAIFGSSFFF